MIWYRLRVSDSQRHTLPKNIQSTLPSGILHTKMSFERFIIQRHFLLPKCWISTTFWNHYKHKHNFIIYIAQNSFVYDLSTVRRKKITLWSLLNYSCRVLISWNINFHPKTCCFTHLYSMNWSWMINAFTEVFMLGELFFFLFASIRGPEPFRD